MSTGHVGALAVLDRAIEGLEDQNPSLLGRTTDVLVYPDDLRIVRNDVAELVAELDKAHKIIRLALNALTGTDRNVFIAAVVDAELGGDGITRANERLALLARVGRASHPDDGCLDCLRKERSGGGA